MFFFRCLLHCNGASNEEAIAESYFMRLTFYVWMIWLRRAHFQFHHQFSLSHSMVFCTMWSVTVLWVLCWFTTYIQFNSWLSISGCAQSPTDSTYWLDGYSRMVEVKHKDERTSANKNGMKRQNRSEQESDETSQSPLPDNRFKSIVLWTTSTEKIT